MAQNFLKKSKKNQEKNQEKTSQECIAYVNLSFLRVLSTHEQQKKKKACHTLGEGSFARANRAESRALHSYRHKMALS